MPPEVPQEPSIMPNQTPGMALPPEDNATKENQTQMPEPEALVSTRNMSDRIGEGEFAIKKTPFEPLHIYVINDSHADAVLVTKGEFTMLIDAGSFAPVRKLLDKLMITKLNVLVATRDYEGAILGMEDVLYMFPPDEFWDNNAGTAKSKKYAEVLSTVEQLGIMVKHPQEGDNLTVNGLDIRVLNPQKQRMNDNPDNDAIVMRLGSGSFCAMLLHPTVQERENAMMGKGLKTSCPVATYFKHGEGRPTSSILIEGNANLEDVIISVGTNSQGLPSPTTLTRLAMKNYNVWRTDQNGTIDIYADFVGNYKVSAYNMSAPVPKRPV
jgi:beta-lactamase superfamily II metal-dependent hydrolase